MQIVKDLALRHRVMRLWARAAREVQDDVKKLKTKEMVWILEDAEKG